MRALHQKIDAVPERAGLWQTKNLFFKDQPGDIYIIRFRDPVAAIESLWRDAKLLPAMVYGPGKFYEDQTKKNPYLLRDVVLQMVARLSGEPYALSL